MRGKMPDKGQEFRHFCYAISDQAVSPLSFTIYAGGNVSCQNTCFKVSPLSEALWSEVLWIFCAVDKSLLLRKDKVRFRQSHLNLWTLFCYVRASPAPSSIHAHASKHMIKHSVHKDVIKARKVWKTHTSAHTKIKIHTDFVTNFFSPYWSDG